MMLRDVERDAGEVAFSDLDPGASLESSAVGAEVLSVGASTPTAVVVMDAEGRLIALNGAAEQILGASSQDALGQPYPAIFGPSLADRLVSLFLHVGRSGDSSQTHRLEARLPTGRRAILQASVGPLRDAAGHVIGILLVAEDCTIQARAVADRADDALRSRRLYQALERYVGDTVAAAVDARPSFVSIGGVRKIVSVLHADVRGYTQHAEALPPDELMRLLIRYHGAAVSALRAAGATLDRFIGDAILALWNAPNPQPDHAERALRGAVALQAAVRSVGTELGYGVGVHTGEVVVGNLGTPEFMNYTAVGDTVNVAARLQAAAAVGEVVCSAIALQQAGSPLPALHLGPLAVKGRRQPVDAYRLEVS